MWFRIGRRISSTGFCVGWSNFASSDPPMMNFGEGEPQTVVLSPAFPNHGAFFFLTRTPYWFAHEPCWFVRKKNAPWFGKAGENTTVWGSPSPKFIMGGSDEEKFDHPTQKQ